MECAKDVWNCNRWLKTLHAIVLIHSYSISHSMSLSEALPTTAIETVCLRAEALQAIVSEGLYQGHYVVARAGFEPATLQ